MSWPNFRQVLRKVYRDFTNDSDQADLIKVANLDLKLLEYRCDAAVSSRTFYGYAAPGTAENESKWFIYVDESLGTLCHRHFAQKDSVPTADFVHKWTDREDLFDELVLPNVRSVLFDGVNDYLEGGDIHQYDIANAFSIGMWVKPDNLAASRLLFSKATLDANVNGYMLRHNITTGELYLQMRTTLVNRNFTFDTALTAGVWQYIVFTYAGGSNINGAHVYRNGVKSTTPASGTLTGTMLQGQPFRIGQRNDSFYFSGPMDEITVWNKELSQSEVDELYNGGVYKNPLYTTMVANLKSYYNFDYDTYPVIKDTIGIADLTMINMTEDDLQGDIP